MFRNSFQSGFLSVFHSQGSNPLQLWSICDSESVPITSENPASFEAQNDDTFFSPESEQFPSNTLCFLGPTKHVSSNIMFVKDSILHSQVLRMVANDISNTFISSPPSPGLSLGIKLHIAIILARNLDKFFSIEFEIIDHLEQSRRFRASNFQDETRVTPEITTMNLRLDEGWNQIIFDLDFLTQKFYNSCYKETSRIILHPNTHLRRLYFASEIVPEAQLPSELRLYTPDTSLS
ncbi:hypothetical protein BB561_005907 [Smittium simulii]|uniref:CFA20 domain-containing protein n=1 Tax=Smittium simulii TaxID=133385 RepID=A0A2T9Y7P0_9FUNG|nr:hypothetical protein BB561_005907 [Smittium simulii]